MRYLHLLLPLIWLSTEVVGQVLDDSVHLLPEVEVRSAELFGKAVAGMSETHVDTLIMESKQSMSMATLLSENTSVFVKEHGRGALSTVSFRGTEASHTQVSWNGLNINSPMTGSVDFATIPVYLADDINLKHGAASIYDSGGGLGGSVNIKNSVNWTNRFNAGLLQGIGSFNTYDEMLHIGGGNARIQAKTRIYHSYSKNDYTFVNRSILNIDTITGKFFNPVDTNRNADFMKYGLLQELYFRPSVGDVLSVKYWWQHSYRSIPHVTSYEGPDNANINRQNDDDHKIVVDWTHLTEKSRLTVAGGFSHDEMLYTLKNNIAGYGIVPAVYSQSTQQTVSAKADFTYDINSKLSINATVSDDFSHVDSQDTVQHSGYKKGRNNLSAKLSVQKNFANRLNINILLRQDVVDDKFVPIIPYIGFDFRILRQREFYVRGNVARNFHLPTLNDMYWVPGGNPLLLPEDGLSGELSLAYVAACGKGLSLRVEPAVYRSVVDNWIIWIPTTQGFWQPMNIAKVVAQGCELSLELKGSVAGFGYKIFANYAFTSSKNYGDKSVWGEEAYGKQLVYTPLHSGNLYLNLSYKGFFIAYQHNSYSERYTTSSNDVSHRDRLYPYFMNDLSIGKKFNIKNTQLSIEFKINNLFNETYHTILYRPMPKQNYLLQIKFDI